MKRDEAKDLLDECQEHAEKHFSEFKEVEKAFDEQKAVILMYKGWYD